jgi:TRAP transporter 4TM/12TM fusion protein
LDQKPGNEGRVRRIETRWVGGLQRLLLIAIPTLSLLFAFNIPSHMGMAILQEQFLGVILIAVLASVFISRPATASSSRTKLPWYDAVFTLLSIAVGGYLAIYYPRIVNDIGEMTADKIIMGTIALALVMEASRRITGWVLIIISAAFILYAHYSYLFPGMLYTRGIPWSRIVVHLYIDPNSLLGIPLTIVANVVIGFILFGQVLFTSGGGQFFTDFATSLLGRFRGGAAKMCVVSSGLFGMISGSPVSNVVITGCVSIPLMKNTGYKSHVAGAIESVASTGGQLMPPIMGAAAFVMAEFLEIPYAKVALAALVPALLYYLALFIQVDLEAGKTGLSRVPEEHIPSIAMVLKRGWIFIFPIALLIYMLFFLNLNAATAAYIAAAAIIPVSYLNREARIGFRTMLTIFEQTGLAMLEVAVVCAVAGIVIGVLTLTGLPFIFTLFVDMLGSHNKFIILLLTGIISLVLGMGMPTTAVYVMVALTLAPALVKLGIDPIAAHLFVFYYAMLSMITPPICIAAFAGAALANANPMRTGYTCMRLGIIAYLIPFIFVYDKLLLFDGPVLLIILSAVTAAAGTMSIGIAMAGYFMRSIGWIKRLLLVAGGIGLLIPPGGKIEYSWTANTAGAAVLVLIVLLEWQARRRLAVAALSSSVASENFIRRRGGCSRIKT